MAQFSTPYDYKSAYSSKDVLTERMTSGRSGIVGGIVTSDFDVTVTAIDNILKDLTISIPSGTIVRAVGTTLHTDATLSLTANWAHIPLSAKIITFQVSMLVNRDVDDLTVEGVVARTARFIFEAYSDELGRFVQDKTNRDIRFSDLVVMPIITLVYSVDANNFLSTTSLFKYRSKHGVDWTYFNTFRHLHITQEWPKPYVIHAFNGARYSGVTVESSPRIQLEIDYATDVVTYIDGVDSGSNIYTASDGLVYMYIDLSNIYLNYNTPSAYNIAYFTLTISKSGIMSGSTTIYKLTTGESKTVQLTGFMTFSRDPELRNYTDSLYNTTGAEITLELL